MSGKNIAKSKVVQLLSTFSQWEWFRFEAFCKSPYHNVQEELSLLATFFSEQRHGLTELHKEQLFKLLRPNTIFKEIQVNHWLSGLNLLAEQFLTQEFLQKQKTQSDLYSLQALSERHLEKHVSFLEKKITKQKDADSKQDATSMLYPNYFFNNLLSENTYRKGERKTNQHLQKTADALDIFYFTEKLRLTCSMLNHQKVLSSSYVIHFLEEIIPFLKQHPAYLEEPSISLYFSIYSVLTATNIDIEYQLFKEKLHQHKEAFSKKELTELYEYGLNFCAAEIRKQRVSYVSEAFTLYKSGLFLKLFMTEGVLSPWHFKNVVRLGLRSEEIEWTEGFILEYTQYLEDSFKEDALHYNLAELYFHTGKYDQVLEHLQKVEFTDLYYNLGAKVMLAKIYYESDAFEALDSLLHAFTTYLRRNKAIPDQTKTAYLNFTKILSKITKTNNKDFTTLKEKIEKMELIGFKDWLLKQVEP